RRSFPPRRSVGRRRAQGAVGLARRPLARGAQGGLVHRQLQPGGRIQGHLGTEGAGMISRVADHCFWFGRYLERAESTARVLHVTSKLALDAELPPQQVWFPVIIVSGEKAQFSQTLGEDAASDGEIVQQY